MSLHNWTWVALLVAAGTAQAQTPQAARRVDHSDLYHGVTVSDPYRWLEAMESAEVLSWIKVQDEYTRVLAGSVAERDMIRERLGVLMDNRRVSSPTVRGSVSLYVESGGELAAPRVMISRDGGEGRVLLDPMELDPSGSLRVTRFAPSDDGRYLAYAVVATGSRWETWRIRDLELDHDLEDELEGLHRVGTGPINWLPDGSGFFYERYPAPEPGQELSQQVLDETLLFHRLGTAQSHDRMIYDPESRDMGIVSTLTRDGRYLVVQLGEAGSGDNAVHYVDVSTGEMIELIPEADAGHYFLGSQGETMWFQTNHGAPNWKVISLDLNRPERRHWKDLIAEREFAVDPTVGAVALGDKIVVAYRRDARLEAHAYRTDGSHAFEVDLHNGGEFWSFKGRQQDRYAYYRLHSVVDPGSTYRLDLETGSSTMHTRSDLPYDPTSFVTRQVFYTSRDGTRVPMFLVHHQDLVLDGSNPIFLYGYGASNWAAAPWFQAKVAVWLQMGGVYALPNLRGGGEYGEDWHQAGIRRNKQNAIDDFVAAAEWLIAEGYTSRELLVGNGGSASGPVIGAAVVQRPELFRASIIDYPALDMLRLEAFTGGRSWRSEFGTVEERDDFEALYAYSPYHNVTPACYPATLVTPGERDESTVPMHAYKFVAALQHEQQCDRPVLLRVSWGAGHNSGATQADRIENWADQLAFLSAELGLELRDRLAVDVSRESE